MAGSLSEDRSASRADGHYDLPANDLTTWVEVPGTGLDSWGAARASWRGSRGIALGRRNGQPAIAAEAARMLAGNRETPAAVCALLEKTEFPCFSNA